MFFFCSLIFCLSNPFIIGCVDVFRTQSPLIIIELLIMDSNFFFLVHRFESNRVFFFVRRRAFGGDLLPDWIGEPTLTTLMMIAVMIMMMMMIALMMIAPPVVSWPDQPVNHRRHPRVDRPLDVVDFFLAYKFKKKNQSGVWVWFSGAALMVNVFCAYVWVGPRRVVC